MSREDVVLRRLVGQDHEAELTEAASVDRSDTERRVRSDAVRREVGPREAGLGPHEQAGEVGGRPGIERSRIGPRRFVGKVPGIVVVAPSWERECIRLGDCNAAVMPL